MPLSDSEPVVTTAQAKRHFLADNTASKVIWI